MIEYVVCANMAFARAKLQVSYAYKAHTRQSSVRGSKDQRLERAPNKGLRGRGGDGKSVRKDMSSHGAAAPRAAAHYSLA